MPRAIADTEMRRKMNLEEDAAHEYQNLEGQINAKDKALAETNKSFNPCLIFLIRVLSSEIQKDIAV